MKQTRILVIRPGAIGDALLAFPVLQALREEHFNPHITLVSNVAVLPLARAWGVADVIFDYQDIRWSELFAGEGIGSTAVHDLLAQTDLAICWLRDPDGIVARNVREAGARRVIIAPGRPPESMSVHIVEYLAGTVGIPVGREGADQSALGAINRPLRGFGAGMPVGADLWGGAPIHRPSLDNQVAIHPGSGGAAKCWPVQSFVEVIERLWQQDRPVLLLAGPADERRLESILELIAPAPEPELLRVLANRPLLEVASYLQACRCYLGNDSGITHLAALLGVPTIALFGPSDPGIWRPVGPIVKVIQERPLERIAADTVMEAIEAF
ncbi:MAG TPA: glycosyltransferase family 9 protein [Ktedonobacteraceae bacterium]|jgi:heptosyltransferase-3|nr:glycosyltransferase family 9 protein [Ktedonobacteraceae bacterium]